MFSIIGDFIIKRDINRCCTISYYFYFIVTSLVLYFDYLLVLYYTQAYSRPGTPLCRTRKNPQRLQQLAVNLLTAL